MKKRLFIALLALLLAVTATSSWILDNIQNEVHPKIIVSPGGALPIENIQDYTITLCRFDEEGTPVPVRSAEELGMAGMLPGDGLRFRLKITKSGHGEKGTVRLLMTDIACEALKEGAPVNSEALLQAMHLAVVPADGYTGNNAIGAELAPEWVYESVADLMTDASAPGNAVIYSELNVPFCNPGDSVNLDCRLWFDTAAEGLENLRFTIGGFELST